MQKTTAFRAIASRAVVFADIPASCTLDSVSGARVEVRGILRIVEKDGWYQVAQRGSHRQLKHPLKTERVTVAGHPSEEMAPGTFNNIRKQAGLK